MLYPYLPEGRQIKYVGSDNAFMQEAHKMAMEFSTDRVQSTGAVVVKDGAIVGRGANISAISNPRLLDLHKKLCPRKLLKVKSGTKYWICPGCATNKMHAESRAVANAGAQAQQADLYLWGHWWCCKPCWDAMIKAGIKDVYLLDESVKLFKR